MPKISNNARRLHPKLRVLRNGSATVNALRSEISSLVVSTAPVPDAADRKDIDLSRLQRDIFQTREGLAPLVEAVGKKKRPGLKGQPAASDAWVNVIVELSRDTSPAGLAEVSEVRALIKKNQPPRGKGQPVRRVAKRPAPKTSFASGCIPISLLSDLESHPGVSFIHPFEPLKLEVPTSEQSGAPRSRKVTPSHHHGHGENVLIGIIDVGGFDFAHSDFLDDNDDTRFLSIWDQGNDFAASPTGFGYGSELTATHFSQALRGSRMVPPVPATLLAPQSQQTEGSHGTHVASIAAGKKGVCPNASIVAVLVEVPMPEDERQRRRSTFSDSSGIIDAVEYLLDVARERDMPISINISLGTNGGAHDGSSGVSRWLDALLAEPGRSICVAAGNAGQASSQSEGDMGWIMGHIHTQGKVASKGLSVDLDWVVMGGGIADVSENELEIWYGAQDRIELQIQPPGSTEWFTVKPGEFIENKRLTDGTTFSVYNELYHPTNGANYISIYLSPNFEPGQIRGVRSGIWRLRLVGEDIRDGSFHGWIERDDPHDFGRIGNKRIFRFPSFFTADTNVDSHSISSLACGHRVIGVANLDAATDSVNVSSSQGPTRDGRFKPEIAASGTDVIAANGFSPDNSKWVSKTGTSMASPYVAGVVGLMLSANRHLTAAQCAAILQRTAAPLPGHAYDWRNDAGFGRIQPKAAVRDAVSFDQRIDVEGDQ